MEKILYIFDCNDEDSIIRHIQGIHFNRVIMSQSAKTKLDRIMPEIASRIIPEKDLNNNRKIPGLNETVANAVAILGDKLNSRESHIVGICHEFISRKLVK
jgi:hypothetical protein